MSAQREQPANERAAGDAFGTVDDERDVHATRPEPYNMVGRFGAPAISGIEDEPGRPVEQSGVTEQFDFPDEIEDSDWVESSSGSVDLDGDPDFDVDDDEDLESESSNGSIARLPMAVQGQQSCRTCRDFLPTDGGSRGWCNNPFAFERRRQVDAEGIACQGTFGNWWTPADDWWLERADISHHSTPTPLVQELIRELRDRQSDGSTTDSQRS